jgi:hypothetical protein
MAASQKAWRACAENDGLLRRTNNQPYERVKRRVRMFLRAVRWRSV